MIEWTEEMAKAFAQRLIELGADKVHIAGPDMRAAYTFQHTGCPLEPAAIRKEMEKFEREYGKS